jgi:hypothetical protein
MKKKINQKIINKEKNIYINIKIKIKKRSVTPKKSIFKTLLNIKIKLK